MAKKATQYFYCGRVTIKANDGDAETKVNYEIWASDYMDLVRQLNAQLEISGYHIEKIALSLVSNNDTEEPKNDEVVES